MGHFFRTSAELVVVMPEKGAGVKDEKSLLLRQLNRFMAVWTTKDGMPHEFGRMPDR